MGQEAPPRYTRPVRSLPALGDVVLTILVGLLILADVALYSGVIVRDRAVDFRVSPAPRLNPVATPTPPRGASIRPDQAAERDTSPDLPGRFVPTQGRIHLNPYPLNASVPFCDPGAVRAGCYASDPPTSSLHLPVQSLVVLPGGERLRIPPDPGVYDFAVPREAIPHIEEHAGVYVGYNCESGGCERAVARLKDIVEQELSLGARVVLSPDPDLAPGSIALAAWTRVDDFPASEYDDARARSFIKAHSCRFDPERFCPLRPLT